MEGKSPKDTEASANKPADVSVYIEMDDRDESNVRSFAIEDHHKNKADNPHREGTNLIPILVRRTNSEELLPKPFKTFNQLIAASYFSFLCCCACGAVAINKSWNAKMTRNNGLSSTAIGEAKRARKLVITALACGTVVWVPAIVIIILVLTDHGV